MIRHQKSLARKILQARRAPAFHVHDVRVLAKSLRAGFRYFDPKLKTFGRADRVLKRHSRALAKFREGEAQRELLAWLNCKGVGLRVHRRQGAHFSRRLRAHVLGICAIAEHSVGQLSAQRHHGVIDYSRLKDVIRDYVKFDPERLHQIRKRSKEIEYQLRFFAPKHKGSKEQWRRLVKINRDLGRIRDLWLLPKQSLRSQLTQRQQRQILKMRDRLERRALHRLRQIV